MTLAYNNKSTSGHGTDGQTDGQSATQYAAPSYGGAPHNNAFGGRKFVRRQSQHGFAEPCTCPSGWSSFPFLVVKLCFPFWNHIVCVVYACSLVLPVFIMLFVIFVFPYNQSINQSINQSLNIFCALCMLHVHWLKVYCVNCISVI